MGKTGLIASQGKKVDRVIDVEFGANLPQILQCIATSGVIATYSSTQVKQPSLPFYRHDVYGLNAANDTCLCHARVGKSTGD